MQAPCALSILSMADEKSFAGVTLALFPVLFTLRPCVMSSENKFKTKSSVDQSARFTFCSGKIQTKQMSVSRADSNREFFMYGGAQKSNFTGAQHSKRGVLTAC